MATKINDGVVVPNSNAIYNVQLLLTSKGLDLGFFDTYVEDSTTTTTTTDRDVRGDGR